MRNLAIGDIHGCTTALATLVKLVEPLAEDRLIFLGDYVDNGPDTAGSINLLLDLKARYELIALRGNHDQLMLDAHNSARAFEAWIEKDGDLTLHSYNLPVEPGSLAKIPTRHWQFLQQTLPYYDDLPEHFFVHANAHPQLPLSQQSEEMLYWEKFGNPQPHASGKVMVCGHTSQKSGLPVNAGHAICLDTRVFGVGWLTCWEVGTEQLWQANQQGQARTLQLSDMPTEVDQIRP